MRRRFARLLHVAQALLPARGAQRRPSEARGERQRGEEQTPLAPASSAIPHSAFRVPHSPGRLRRRAGRSACATRAGFSLVEMLASVVIFGIFLVILVGLQREFLRYDGEMRVALFTHPAPLSVLARLRRDVLDSRGYPSSEGTWEQSPSILLLDTVGDDGRSRVVVWDFSTPRIARRIERLKGETVSDWEARAVPAFRIDSWEAPDGRTGVLVTARDGGGNVVVDQIVTPRAR